MTKKILIDEAVVKQALEALESTGLFLHHCWCDVQMNEHSFDKLNKQMEIVDAEITALREALEVNNKGVNALAEQPAVSAGPITPAMMQGPTPEQKSQMVAAMSKLAEQPAPGRAVYEDGDVFERIAARKKQQAAEPVAWAKDTGKKLRITVMDMTGEQGWHPLIYGDTHPAAADEMGTN